MNSNAVVKGPKSNWVFPEVQWIRKRTRIISFSIIAFNFINYNLEKIILHLSGHPTQQTPFFLDFSLGFWSQLSPDVITFWLEFKEIHVWHPINFIPILQITVPSKCSERNSNKQLMPIPTTFFGKFSGEDMLSFDSLKLLFLDDVHHIVSSSSLKKYIWILIDSDKAQKLFLQTLKAFLLCSGQLYFLRSNNLPNKVKLYDDPIFR